MTELMACLLSVPGMAGPLAAPLLGACAGAFLTLMDRIDEHGVIVRWKTPLAWLCGALTAGVMVVSIQRLPFVYPFLFGQCLEWTVKGKIDYPSHVFFLFLLALYFGFRIELLQQYAPAIALFLTVRWFSGTWLKERLSRQGKLYGVLYGCYLEKFMSDMVLAASIGQWQLLAYSLGYTCLCYGVKQALPEPPKTETSHA